MGFSGCLVSWKMYPGCQMGNRPPPRLRKQLMPKNQTSPYSPLPTLGFQQCRKLASPNLVSLVIAKKRTFQHFVHSLYTQQLKLQEPCPLFHLFPLNGIEKPKRTAGDKVENKVKASVQKIQKPTPVTTPGNNLIKLRLPEKIVMGLQ